MEHVKAKSAWKTVLPRGEELRTKILSTMKTIAALVGGTLGPGGHPVLIERQEYGLPPTITKDGVTVFRSLGFADPISHCIMEAARDASVRTAAEAGDGTTTATVLAEAFARYTDEFLNNHKNYSSQVVIRHIQKIYSKVMVPELDRITIRADLESDEGRRLLTGIATVSGNGDAALAAAVMQCYDICGDDGNVTIAESSGPYGYEVEKVEGYPIPVGFEESCIKFAPAFVNRPETQQIVVDKPAFLLYFGRINDIQTLVPVMTRLQDAWTHEYLTTPNVVVVATGFSESVLASLATNWVSPGSINILPVLLPQTPQHNGQRHSLDDLAAVTGATVFDPLTKPLEDAEFNDFGNIAQNPDNEKWEPLGVTGVECGRYRTTVIGFCQEDILLQRIEQVRAMSENAGSELDATWTRERLAKLTGGIARLKVIGSSNGELKERRDRAEDAICAVRGAIKHGCLIGGCWSLVRLFQVLPNDDICNSIIKPALLEPALLLYSNAGIVPGAVRNEMAELLNSARQPDPKAATVLNAATGETVNGFNSGLLDSVPAVREALKNSISIATLLGTLGGTVVFPRDSALERSEARDSADFNRNANFNPADERP